MRGLFGSLAAGLETKATDISALTWSALFGGPTSSSGVAVSVSTVLACGRVRANGLAQIPLKVLRVDQDGRRTPALDHPVYKLLYSQPNDWMTSFEFREMLAFHAILTGDAYAYIGRGMGKIVELIPLVPAMVTPVQDISYGLTYAVADRSGQIATLPRESVLHIRNTSWNGYRGMNAIHLAREAIGLAIATEESQARLHRNGVKPSGILSMDGTLDKDARTRLRVGIKESHEGSQNAGRVMILDRAAKFQSMMMTGVDSQHLETRRLQIEEICRHLNVFPQMVMHTDKTSTFASADAFFTANVVNTIAPDVARWEGALKRDLLSDDDALVAKFNINGLLRGDSAARADFYLKALGGARAETAYMTRNEVRELEDLDPIEGGDVLPIPVAPEPVQPEPIGGPDTGPAKAPTPNPTNTPSGGTN
jgi:HK97 family phage portal protein